MAAERHAQMSAEERLQIASDMFNTARRIIESSLPDTLSRPGSAACRVAALV
jgi:hypothetical protein